MSTLMFAKMAAERAASEEAAQRAQRAAQQAQARAQRQRLPPLQGGALPLAAADVPAADVPAEAGPATQQAAAEAKASTAQGIGQYVEALAGLIPSEVLTLHALTLTVTTTVVSPGSTAHDKIMAAISPAASEATSAAAGAATTVATKTVEATASVAAITAPETLKAAFWALIALSLLLYLVPRGYNAWKAAKPPVSGWYWYRELRFLDWVSAMIPPLSFVAWTMLQRTTTFDAAFPNVAEANRTVFGLFLAVVLLAVSGWVAFTPIPSNGLPNQGGGGAANDDNDPADDPNAGGDAPHGEAPTGATPPNG